ncbi:MAG: hypoxanthine phosphoribosyltransferase [Verrucomicrobia bacterium]|nr:hypoxanthine phosphoribosyltransferase [Verrucomicrobiota bacterium]
MQRKNVAPSNHDGEVPRPWRRDLAEVLVLESEIKRKVRLLARRIEQDFKGRDLVVVALLKGTVLFLADLVRHIRAPLRLGFIGVSSYRQGSTRGRTTVTQKLAMELRGRDVLLVDDILDTGKTLTFVIRIIKRCRPAGIHVCVLLDKPSRRTHPVKADYVGFQIPDHFVVGYGMDYEERFRNLPFIAVLRARAFPEKTRHTKL